MSSLSRFVKATVRLFELIESEENIKEIVKYMKVINLTKNIKFDIPIIIQNKARQFLIKIEQLSTDERFYYQNTPNLRSFNDKSLCMFRMQNSSMFSRCYWFRKNKYGKGIL